MKPVIHRTRGRSLLRWSQVALFAAGALALSYCAFVVVDSWYYQKREDREFRRLVHQEASAKPPAKRNPPARHPAKEPATSQAIAPVIAEDGLIGRIEIPRLGISAVLSEGTDQKTLRRAVGHIEGTALPGQPGNMGIAGHRDTFFRPLRHIRPNDIIVVAALNGRFRYRVTSTKVVPPTAVDVLAPTPGQTLTLVTCYPFYYVGSAPRRFIVKAERMTG